MKQPSRKMTATNEFQRAFVVIWKRVESKLAADGIEIGATVRNKDGILFRLEVIEPRVYNFGNPGASISCYGVRYRANGTWGTHQHWVGDIDDLTVES